MARKAGHCGDDRHRALQRRLHGRTIISGDAEGTPALRLQGKRRRREDQTKSQEVPDGVGAVDATRSVEIFYFLFSRKLVRNIFIDQAI